MSRVKNVAYSLSKFGLSETTSDVIVFAFTPSEATEAFVASSVGGSLVALDLVKENCSPESPNYALIKKEYKIGDKELALSTLEQAVIQRIASRSI